MLYEETVPLISKFGRIMAVLCNSGATSIIHSAKKPIGGLSDEVSPESWQFFAPHFGGIAAHFLLHRPKTNCVNLAHDLKALESKQPKSSIEKAIFFLYKGVH